MRGDVGQWPLCRSSSDQQLPFSFDSSNDEARDECSPHSFTVAQSGFQAYIRGVSNPVGSSSSAPWNKGDLQHIYL